MNEASPSIAHLMWAVDVGTLLTVNLFVKKWQSKLNL